ncbi:hypothetical protein KEM48_005613 [Puccinia striiformis f. sp. tritici PST-130]|nr:hypothetical protein KEM48_005613 [Puccinia striiformis f. sp. tritici PST-130]
MRCEAIYCDHKDDLKSKINELMEFDNSRPILLHVKVTDKEHCFPMVPAGKALHEQIYIHSSGRNLLLLLEEQQQKCKISFP